MATATIETLPKSSAKLTITVPHDELAPHLEEAAKRISEHTQIQGFRPGHATLEAVKAKVGEMRLYEEALETAVRSTYTQAVLQHQLDTVGSPKIDIVKLAPANDLIYTAEVSLLPAIKSLADFRTLHVEAKTPEVPEHDLDLALKDLQRMQTKEVRVQTGEAAGATDKVVLSVNMKKNGVGVEGGQSPNHAVYLGEEYYIPGFKDHLIGMKEGEEKTFSLPFPKEHPLKNLAGSDVDFEIALKEVYKLEPPTLDDAFAVSLGQKDLAALRERLKENMMNERTEEEAARQEREVLESLAKASSFEDIPDLLLNEEIRKMVSELEYSVEQQGVTFDQYLSSIGKTLAQLKLDFTQQALTRIKIALILRELARKENVQVDDKEMEAELDRLAEQHTDAESKKRIYSPEYREYMESIMRNRKVLDMLKGAMVKA